MTRPLDYTDELASPSEPNSAAPLLQLAFDDPRTDRHSVVPGRLDRLLEVADHFGQLRDAGDQMDRADLRWGRAGDQDRHNLSLSAYYNLVKPQFGADWQLRPQVMLIF